MLCYQPRKKFGALLTVYPVYIVDLYGRVCAHMCMLVCMQAGYKC